jgi:hypothetical protein
MPLQGMSFSKHMLDTETRLRGRDNLGVVMTNIRLAKVGVFPIRYIINLELRHSKAAFP